MRIGLVSTLATTVRSGGAGSVESLVWLLAREFTKLGHDVTVFAADGSEAAGRVIATAPGIYGENGAPDDWQLCEFMNLCAAAKYSREFDVLHSHVYLWGLPLEPLARARMVHTLHVMPDISMARLRAIFPGACVTGISCFQWSLLPDMPPSAVIYHGVDENQLPFSPQASDYVCYLGRFTSGKGVLRAISAARALDFRLILAGPRNAYFDQHVRPLVDGGTVEYVGPVSRQARAQLLGGARALLYPIASPEPFGLVLAEAFMCGTPTAAIGIGAVPEIVDEGITGFCADQDTFEYAVLRAVSLDRRRVRDRATERFSSERMAREYLNLYVQRAADGAPTYGTS